MVDNEKIAEARDDLDNYGGQVSPPDALYNPAALAVLSAANVFRDAYDAIVGASPLVEFVVDCPKCGEPASAGNTLFADWEPGKPLQIDLEMAASQVTFTCTAEDCGITSYAGDYEVHYDDEDDDYAAEGGASNGE